MSDVWMAYQVDATVHAFGSALQTELESVEGKNKNEIKRKREAVLSKWLGIPRKFRNPGMVGSGIEQQMTVKGSQP